MMRRFALSAVLGPLAFALWAAPAVAAEPAVRWSAVERTYPVDRRGPDYPYPPLPEPDPPELKTRNVVLENRLVRIEVAPDLAGRVMHVTYKADGTDLFQVKDSIVPCTPWDAGGWRTSFPFHEHGMRFKGQTAGWRIIEGADGSVTLAMDMRFGRFRDAAELDYKGRFSHLRLGRTMTLRPGQAFFECAMRVENPLPYRVGWRLWTTNQFPVAEDAEFIIPASRMSGHGARDIEDWPWGEGLALYRNWTRPNYSLFALNNPYPFLAIYYPEDDVNRVRVADPAEAPGGKLWGWQCGSSGARFFEVWTGLDRVFEQEGRLLAPFATGGFTERVYLVRGVGRVAYANADAAVGLEYAEENGRATAVLRATPACEIADAEVTLAPADGGEGRTVRTALEPMETLEIRAPVAARDAPVRVTIRAGARLAATRGRTLLQITLPLARPPVDLEAEKAIAESVWPGDDATPKRLCEMGERIGRVSRWGDNIATTGLRSAREWIAAEPESAEAHVALGRIAYELGLFDEARAALKRAAALDPAEGVACHLLGLVLLEEGKADEARAAFESALSAGRPSAEAGYFTALAKIALGRFGEAAEDLKRLVESRPEAFRPRLALAAVLARLGKVDEARALADGALAEDPASVEAAETVARCCPDDAARREAVEQLLRHNPEAPEALAAFCREVDEGVWQHPQRPEEFREAGHRTTTRFLGETW